MSDVKNKEVECRVYYFKTVTTPLLFAHEGEAEY